MGKSEYIWLFEVARRGARVYAGGVYYGDWNGGTLGFFFFFFGVRNGVAVSGK